MKRRLFLLYASLAAANAGAWAWALAAFHGQPLLLGMAALAYGLGLRHAVDADHIAAIDNVTRKLMQDGARPLAAGLYFSLGHSTVVVLASLAIALAVHSSGEWGRIAEAGAAIGTTVSVAFLLAIAMANFFVLLSVCRRYRAVKEGAVDVPQHQHRGLFARLLRPLFALVSRSWHMYPLGLLFGLGFDTATEIGLLGISAAQASKGLPPASVLVFPALFAAGMSLVDTLDNTLMVGVYGWALEDPARKLRYNLAITALSVAVAALVGGIEAAEIIGERLGTSGEVWAAIIALNDPPERLGLAIMGLFAILWLIAASFHRFRHEGAACAAPEIRAN